MSLIFILDLINALSCLIQFSKIQIKKQAYNDSAIIRFQLFRVTFYGLAIDCRIYLLCTFVSTFFRLFKHNVSNFMISYTLSDKYIYYKLILIMPDRNKQKHLVVQDIHHQNINLASYHLDNLCIHDDQFLEFQEVGHYYQIVDRLFCFL